MDEGKEPIRPSLFDRSSDLRFGRRKMLPGNFPCNPQLPRERDEKEEDRFVKELGTTSDMFTELKSSSLRLVRFRTILSKEICSRLR